MQFTGKTVEEATATGLNELGLKEDEAVITVIEEPTKGLFGKLKGKAVVEIEKKQSESGALRALNFVKEILDYLGMEASADFNGDEERPVITLVSENSSSVIGYRGEVLDALQVLAGAIANIGNNVYKKVVVDCENYRERREATLIKLAHKLEEKATDMRREVILEPMTPYERRIIHTALSESQTVTTKSEGKEPNRYVVIVPFDKDEFSKPYNAGRNNSGSRTKRFSDRKGGRKNDRGGKNFKGGNRNNRNGKSGFSDEKRKPSSGFGTYLGNSFKDF